MLASTAWPWHTRTRPSYLWCEPRNVWTITDAHWNTASNDESSINPSGRSGGDLSFFRNMPLYPCGEKNGFPVSSWVLLRVGNFCLIEEGPQVFGCTQNHQCGLNLICSDYRLGQQSHIMGFKRGGGGGEGARTFSLSVLVCPSPLQMKTSVPGRNTVKTIITF